jgi:hypothetical protein
MRGPSDSGVYTLRTTKQAMTATVLTLDEWHECLGHPNRQKLVSLVQNKMIDSSSSTLTPCASCLLGKLARLPLASVEHKSF